MTDAPQIIIDNSSNAGDNDFVNYIKPEMENAIRAIMSNTVISTFLSSIGSKVIFTTFQASVPGSSAGSFVDYPQIAGVYFPDSYGVQPVGSNTARWRTALENHFANDFNSTAGQSEIQYNPLSDVIVFFPIESVRLSLAGQYKAVTDETGQLQNIGIYRLLFHELAHIATMKDLQEFRWLSKDVAVARGEVWEADTVALNAEDIIYRTAYPLAYSVSGHGRLEISNFAKVSGFDLLNGSPKGEWQTVNGHHAYVFKEEDGAKSIEKLIFERSIDAGSRGEIINHYVVNKVNVDGGIISFSASGSSGLDPLLSTVLGDSANPEQFGSLTAKLDLAKHGLDLLKSAVGSTSPLLNKLPTFSVTAALALSAETSVGNIDSSSLLGDFAAGPTLAGHTHPNLDSTFLPLTADDGEKTLLVGASGFEQRNVHFNLRRDDLIGGDQNDILIGGAGDGAGVSVASRLDGGRGNDLLIAYNGKTDMIGGAGNDVLVLGAGQSSSVDGGAGKNALILSGAGTTVDLTNMRKDGKGAATQEGAFSSLKNVKFFIGSDVAPTKFTGSKADRNRSVFIAGAAGGDFTLFGGESAFSRDNVRDVFNITLKGNVSGAMSNTQWQQYIARQGIYIDKIGLEDEIYVNGKRLYGVEHRASLMPMKALGSGNDVPFSAVKYEGLSSFEINLPTPRFEIANDPAGYYYTYGKFSDATYTPAYNRDGGTITLAKGEFVKGADPYTSRLSLTEGLAIELGSFQNGDAGLSFSYDTLSANYRMGAYAYQSWDQPLAATVNINRDFDGVADGMTVGGGATINTSSSLYRSIVDNDYLSSEIDPHPNVFSKYLSETMEIWNGDDDDNVTVDIDDDVSITLGDGDDRVVGGAGSGLYYGDEGNDLLDAGAGDDLIDGGSGDDVVVAGEGSDTIYGGEGNDQLNGGAGEDLFQFDAGDGSDIVDGGEGIDAIDLTEIAESASVDLSYGSASYDGGSITISNVENAFTGAGDDVLIGSAGDNVLGGGGGNDMLRGEAGSDSYRYASGDGADTIVEHGAAVDTDTLALVNLDDTDVDLRRDANDLYVRDRSNGAEIRVADHFYNNEYGLEQLTFAGGVIWDRAAIQEAAWYRGTSAAEEIVGTSDNDTLVGGGGTDVLRGHAGSDTYRYASGDGFDSIVESDSGTGDTDRLILTDLNQSGVTLRREGNDLFVSDASQAGEIKVADHFYDSAHGIEQLVFADGTTWDRAAIQQAAWYRGTGAAEEIAGSSDGDTFLGGAGADLLRGETGSDSYRYAAGDGADTIAEHGGAADVDALILTDLDASDVTLRRDANDLYLKDDANAAEIKIADHFYNNEYGLEQLVFADGTIWNRAAIQQAAWYRGTNIADTIYGSADADTLVGGTGDDMLRGETGSDSYRYAAGDGADTIVEHGGAIDVDTLVLTDLNATEVTLRRDANDLYVRDTARATEIKVADHFYNNEYGLEKLVFADGTIWDRAAIQQAAWYRGTSGADQIDGSSENDTIVGSEGDDTLRGGNGDDSYRYDAGDGADTIAEHGAASETDRLVLTDLNSAGVTLRREGNHLFVKDNARAVEIKVADHFYNNDYGLEELTFADGTIWDRAAIQRAAWYRGTSAAEFIDGSGDDDTILGGEGDDTLRGGAGSDSYRYASGDGADIIADNSGGSGGTDRLVLTNLNANGVTLRRRGNSLWARDTVGAIEIEVPDQFYNDDDGLEELVFADGSMWDRQAIRRAAWYRGDASDETLLGTEFDETFQGHGGNDVIDGQDGYDTAVYAGLKSTYSLSTSAGTVQIVDNNSAQDGDDGTDTLYSIEKLLFKNGETTALASPIVLDLDRDGVQLRSIAQSGASFDFDGDGIADRTSWVGSGDGLLYYDRDGNGTVSGAAELSFLGEKAHAKSDLDGLSGLDQNGDGAVSAADAAFSALGVWRDRNGNGKVDGGETMTLAQSGVASISVHGMATEANWDWDAAVIVNRGSFTRSDGSVSALADVAFNYRSSRDIANGRGGDDSADATRPRQIDAPQSSLWRYHGKSGYGFRPRMIETEEELPAMAARMAAGRLAEQIASFAPSGTLEPNARRIEFDRAGDHLTVFANRQIAL